MKKHYSETILNRIKLPHKIKINNINYNKEYLEKFTVGLLEGNGTITTDFSKKSLTCRIRIVISLLNLPENKSMLTLIKNRIAGRVVVEKKDKYITWIASTKKDVKIIMSILEKYPLLTQQKKAQLSFVISCMTNTFSSKEEFFISRNYKYNNYIEKQCAVNLYNDSADKDSTACKKISYFNSWLSGFIEAKGNFSLVKTQSDNIKKAGFSIGQTSDKYIIEQIKIWFDSHHKITIDKKLR